MRSQLLFHTEKLKRSLFLAFEIESDMIKCSLNIFLQNKLQRNSILAFKIQSNMITCGTSLSLMQQCEKSLCALCSDWEDLKVGVG